MQGTDFERAFFQGIAQSGARVLLIGRRALVAIGLPLLAANYDFCVHPEDVARSPEEIEHTQALVRWFCRRYPTVGERFAYVRRTYKRWTRQPK